MTRRTWLALIAVLLALVLGGRMGLRFLDWKASEAARSSPEASGALAD